MVTRKSRPAAVGWLAENPGKRWTELFFLAYSPVWIAWCLGLLVPLKLYDVRCCRGCHSAQPVACASGASGPPCRHRPAPPTHPRLLLLYTQRLGEWGYMCIGLAAALPCVVLPPLLECRADRGKPLSQRYWVKANVWIAVFSFVGNYFWTHYFYELLGAAYTFPAHRLNQAGARRAQPHRPVLRLLQPAPSASHSPTAGAHHPLLHDACLLLLLPHPVQPGHTAHTGGPAAARRRGAGGGRGGGRFPVGLRHRLRRDADHRALPILCLQGRRRRARGSGGGAPPPAALLAAGVALALPPGAGACDRFDERVRCALQDKSKMYTVGSLFYAIYFFVSFPMFFRMDEDSKVGGWLAAVVEITIMQVYARSDGCTRLVHALNEAHTPRRRGSVLQAKPSTLWRAVADSLAASMLVTCLLDFWRISMGGIVETGGPGKLPWLSA